MEKTIKLTFEQAKELYGKDPVMDKLLEESFPLREETWESLGVVEGYYISPSSTIDFAGPEVTNGYNRNIFATVNQAHSALAMSQLSQLMKHHNGDWEPDWDDRNEPKFVIARIPVTLRPKDVNTCVAEFEIVDERTCKTFLAFKNEEDAKKVFKDNLSLVMSYYSY